MHQFQYLGHILDDGANDDHAKEDRQLERARAEWGRIGRILLVSTRGTNPRTMGYFYKAIVQYVLLLYHGSESWIRIMDQNHGSESWTGLDSQDTG